MPLRVLLIPDKFKGTLTAVEAAEAMSRGWLAERPGDEVSCLPMSDGGDGFGEIVSKLMGALPRRTSTCDAAHRPCEVTWWWHEESGTAVIESARVIGLARLPAGKYHPFELDTEGLGAVLRAALEAGACRCMVGIGGSATNDAGFGMAKALGWQFFNSRGSRIDRWSKLHTLGQLRPPEAPLTFASLLVAVDVQNPLLGPHGCTRVYGPQKGLRPEEFDFAERCLERLSELLVKELHLNHAEEPGSGAAGGLGYGLRTFLGATLRSGFEMYAEQACLTERMERVDVVVTGEGALDASTLMGKGVGEVARLCQRLKVPCIGLGGVVKMPAAAAADLFIRVEAMAPDYVPMEEAMRRPGESLTGLTGLVARQWPD